MARPGAFSRFPLLRAVDEKYENAALDETQQARPLPQVAEHLRRYAAAHFGLYANRKLFACFLGGMAASDFLLLRSVSGEEGGEIGPLTLCRAVAAAWGQDISIIHAQGAEGDLLGGPEPGNRRYRETELLRAVYEAGYNQGVCFTMLEGIAAAPQHSLSQLLPILALSHHGGISHNSANFTRGITLAQSAWPGDPLLLQNGALPWPGNLWLVGALPPGGIPAQQLRGAAMEFCLPPRQGTKAFLTPLENPAPLPARQLRDLFTHAREVCALPEEALRLYALTEQYLAEHMDLSLGAQAGPQLRAFGSVCLACGLRPAQALDGFFYHKALRRLDRADPAALKYELPGLRRFLGETFGRRALPLTLGMLEGMLNG